MPTQDFMYESYVTGHIFLKSEHNLIVTGMTDKVLVNGILALFYEFCYH